MSEQIKLETVGLGEILISIANLQHDVQTTRNEIFNVIRNLDWEVKSKEQIEDQLNSLNKELQIQEEKLTQMDTIIKTAITKSDGFNDDFVRRAMGIITSIIALVSSFFPGSKNGLTQYLTKVKDWLGVTANNHVNENEQITPEFDGKNYGQASIPFRGIENRGKGKNVEAKLDAYFDRYKGTKFAIEAEGGIGCAAFARSVWTEIYGVKGFQGKCSIKEVGLSDSVTIRDSIFVGDVIRMESGTGNVHWFVIKGWDESGLTVYQSEGIDHGKANTVLETTYPWSGGSNMNSSIANFFNTEKKLSKNAKFIIHHANNYDAING